MQKRLGTAGINIVFTSKIVLPGHLEGRGLFTLCGHWCAVSAPYGWYLESTEVLQQDAAGSDGPRARGTQDWLVQPVCPPPFLRSHGRQLWCHADESHTDPQHAVQSKVKTVLFPHTLIGRKLKWAAISYLHSEGLFPWAQVTGRVLWVGCD